MAIELCEKHVGRLRDMSPLWEMYVCLFVCLLVCLLMKL